MEVDPDPELVPGQDPEEEEGQALLPLLAPAALLLALGVVEVKRDQKLDHTRGHVQGLVLVEVPGQAVEEEVVVVVEGVMAEEVVAVEEVDPVMEEGTVKAVDMEEVTVAAATECMHAISNCCYVFYFYVNIISMK